MKITDRAITQDELQMIYDDFTKIELRDGIPQTPVERYQFTAEENGTVKGFVSGLTEHKWFYLSDLWVAEAYRGHGLGTELLCRMEEKAKAVGMTQIYTWTTGPRNMRFYEKCGYQRFAVFEDFCEVPGYHRVGYKKDL